MQRTCACRDGSASGARLLVRPPLPGLGDLLLAAQREPDELGILAVGQRLARLARHAQVIVVTHLPQVAAHASTHLQIVKTSQDGATSSTVETLDRPGRIRELARMLAGDDASDVALAHAEELLDEAGRTGR